MEKVKLSKICNINAGGTPARNKKEYWNDGNIPWCKISDLSDKYITKVEEYITEEGLNNSSAKLFKKGTILYTIFATIGEVAILNIDSATNQAIAGIEIKDNHIELNYLYYFLKSLKNIMQNKSRGVAQNNINLSILRNTEIWVPAKIVQVKIANKLDKVQEIIDIRKKQIKQLDDLIKSQFVEMFGKIEKQKVLKEYIISLDAGKSLVGEEECINKVLKTGSVSYDYFNEKEIKNLPINYMPRNEHKVNVGDVIISRMNTAELVGAVGYVWNIDDNIYIPDRLWKANLKDNVNPIFMWQLLIQDDVKEKIKKICSGTSGSMKNISKEKFLKLKVKDVPIDLQNKFAEFVKQIDKQKFKIQKILEEIQKLQESLMYKYFG